MLMVGIYFEFNSFNNNVIHISLCICNLNDVTLFEISF